MFFSVDVFPVWLDYCLDLGISEWEFWNMTIAELSRATASKERVKKRKAQEQASFDYIQADLIGRSIGRIYSSSTKIPPIEQVYSLIFDDAEIKEKQQQRQLESSVIRFKQFAAHNNKRWVKQ